MDQSTHDVRRANWFNIITECQQRPASVSVRQWLSDNGIKEKAYYYWQRKFRREACEKIQLPAVTTQAKVSFAEFHVPEPIPEKFTTADHAVAAIHANGSPAKPSLVRDSYWSILQNGYAILSVCSISFIFL